MINVRAFIIKMFADMHLYKNHMNTYIHYYICVNCQVVTKYPQELFLLHLSLMTPPE